jgi:hypothetical protein
VLFLFLSRSGCLLPIRLFNVDLSHDKIVAHRVLSMIRQLGGFSIPMATPLTFVHEDVVGLPEVCCKLISWRWIDVHATDLLHWKLTAVDEKEVPVMLVYFTSSIWTASVYNPPKNPKKTMRRKNIHKPLSKSPTQQWWSWCHVIGRSLFVRFDNGSCKNLWLTELEQWLLWEDGQ